jgi:GNAT superfamily N-acetyltransferase
VHVRPIGIDDLAHVRYVHRVALVACALGYLAKDQTGAVEAHVEAPDYTDSLIATVAEGRLLGGWIGSELTGTAGWLPAHDGGDTARVELLVQPLFRGFGIGRRLMSEIERHAVMAGCQELTVRTTEAAAGFFRKHGFTAASRGVQSLGSSVLLPAVSLRKIHRSGRRLLH